MTFILVLRTDRCFLDLQQAAAAPYIQTLGHRRRSWRWRSRPQSGECSDKDGFDAGLHPDEELIARRWLKAHGYIMAKHVDLGGLTYGTTFCR